MTIDQTSPPQPKQKGQPEALPIQDQENEKVFEEDFVIQVTKRAKKEWETFHLEHPDVDEETFRQAQRFCLNQWFLQHGTTLADLPAFGQAEKHFVCEVQQRAIHIEATTEMMENPIYSDAHLLGAYIAAQAQERSEQAREAIKQLSSNTTPYMTGKINQLRGIEQAQGREQEAWERQEGVRQDIDQLKALGISREYENQKEELREREKQLREQMSTLGHLLAENQHQIDTARHIQRCEEWISTLDQHLEELRPKTLETYCVREAVGTMHSDWDAATQRAMQVRVQAETWEDSIRAIQAGIQDALTRAKAQIEHVRNVKQALERMQQRRAAIEQWAKEAKQEAQERKKKMQEARHIYINIMRKARNDLFGEKARWAVRSDTAGQPGSGYQRVHPRPLPSGDRARDTKATNAADEAELESIYRQGERRAAASPDPTRPGTGAGQDAFRCAERFVQAKAVEQVIKTEEQLIQVIERARSNTQDAIEQLQSIYEYLHEIKKFHLSIVENGVKLVKSLRKEKKALERAVSAAETYARDAQEACNQQSMSDQGEAEMRARKTARQEMEAYAQAKKYTADALHYLQEISTEYSNMEGPSSTLMKHFADFLQGSLPFEQEILDRALSGVKQIVKRSMRLLSAEEQARKAAHQTAIEIETGSAPHPSRAMTNEQEVLLLAALANDALAEYATYYYLLHVLAVYVATEQFEAMLQTSAEQLLAALQVVKKDIDEMKQQKESKGAQRQTTTLDNAGRQAHLLIDERTGAITLKDGRAAFHLQDLAGIDEAPAEGHSGQSRLLFKGDHPCSSYDVAHDQLHEGCETRTRIHLQVPNGAGEQEAMLCLPNGIYIKVADIDLGQTKYDPVRPEGGVTITLKKDGHQINLLAAASIMTGSLTQEVLRELMDRSLDQSIHRLEHATDIKNLEDIEGSFSDVKYHDRNRRYIYEYVLSREDVQKRQEDFLEWTEHILYVTSHAHDILCEYADGVLSEEIGEKEITEATVIEQTVSGQVPDGLFQKRMDCLQKIVRARGLDTIITCQSVDDPDDSSAETHFSSTIQEMITEYELTKSLQQAERWQDTSPSDTWASYLAQLRRAILDEAPAFFRAKLLLSQIREAVEADHWGEGTAENPGVIRLAEELEAGPSDVDERDHQGDNDYASALHVFIQQTVAGVQGVLKTENPFEILSRIGILDLAFGAIEHAETTVWQALDLTTPTALARALIEQIGSEGGKGIQDDSMSHARGSQEKPSLVRRPR